MQTSHSVCSATTHYIGKGREFSDPCEQTTDLDPVVRCCSIKEDLSLGVPHLVLINSFFTVFVSSTFLKSTTPSSFLR